MTISTLENEFLQIKINTHGAELQSYFAKKQNIECLWQADPNYWGRQAPILFPIVGRLANDQLVHNAKKHPMTQHGFARDSEFSILNKTDSTIQLALTSNEKTLSQYPFKFELIVAFQLKNNRLITSYNIRNPNTVPLPASIGAHPAFNWPLDKDISKAQYFIDFHNNESAPIRQLDQGLMLDETFPNPVQGNKLNLKNDLFENDALIFDKLESREIRYSSGNNLSITLRFDDFPHLGIWTKPNAPFICLEPWQGYSSSVNFNGEFSKKNGIMLIPEKSEVTKSFEILLGGDN